MHIVILGLSIVSSWGNGHVTTYRGLVRELKASGHTVLFLERDKPWYAANRDLPVSSDGDIQLYGDVPELDRKFAGVGYEGFAVAVRIQDEQEICMK
ncbi:MAG: hypothetical protein A2X46_16260 [Lentisphaerae bacterium GWF2_57_35]|nr:MAG: hypothetical protein A2X46_16260 [Lentisphaerae bacterium GWF2_57_35]